MELPDDARELQRIADYRAAAKVLRGVSNGRIVSGLLFIGFGVTERGNVYAYALAVLGVIMIGVGIGSRLAPAASWLLIHAITGISIGVINLGVAALALVIGMRGWLPLLCGGLGVFILLASVRRLGLYSRYGDALSDPATADESRELASLVQAPCLPGRTTTRCSAFASRISARDESGVPCCMAIPSCSSPCRSRPSRRPTETIPRST